MIFPRNIYKQTATYWAKGVLDGFGNITYFSPILLSVRWQESSLRIINFNSIQEPSKAEIWLKQVITIGSYLSLGDQTAFIDPTAVSTAFLVKMFEQTPSVDNQYIMYKAYL